MSARLWLLAGAAGTLGLTGVGVSTAVFSDRSANPGNEVRASGDWTAPAVSRAQIVKASGGTGGYIRAGGNYHVYAAVSDGGRHATGLSLATADVSALTLGVVASPLVPGSYSADGVSYDQRSSALVAASSLAEGTHGFSVTATDGAGNSARTEHTVVVDNTSPSGSNVQTTNVAGGTTGRPEVGDEVVLTYSETLEAVSVLAGWSGAATDVVVRIADGGSGNDVLTVRPSGNSTQLPLGSVNLGRSDYVTATRDFGASGTPSRMSLGGSEVRLTLGTPSGTTSTARSRGTMTWTPAGAATDRAGNPCSTTARGESGGNDYDF